MILFLKFSEEKKKSNSMKWSPQWKDNLQDSGNECSGPDSVSISFYTLVFELRKLEAGKVISQNAEWFLSESGYGSVH